jgi:acyl-CoA synthetase (AMP-forming)/AMP-acid ligase II
LSLAVAGRGATPVFVDPGIGLERLSRCIQDADPAAFIGSPKAHLLRFLRRSLFHRIKFHVTASEWAFSRGYSLGYFKRFANAPIAPVPLPVLRDDGSLRARDAALIAFTSGATGTPKGVVITNSMMSEQLRAIREVLGQKAGTADLTLLPIFSLFNVALGVASVFPTMPPGKPLALDPAQVVKLVGDLGIESSFGSPTLWHKIAEYALRSGATLPTIKRVRS